MSIPAIIVLVLIGIDLLVAANQHGKPRDNTNFWYRCISVALTVGLLYWGGFFN